ncbi:uncharacterized protein si:ch211-151h10.2 [Esox lucius]|uniref:uncharacterized protein si:ch211-151h10.2 n=1 Tax=Esox lucius TaxID=8010 RepID=UPI0010BDCC45|nr:uncharacterized protein si:ch211-151h10.2 [Esox lucius]
MESGRAIVQVLTESLILCVLMEPMVDPTPPHIQTLIDRLQSVCEVLQKTDVQSETKSRREGVAICLWRRRHPATQQTDSNLSQTLRVKHITYYLKQRTERLCALQEVQHQFGGSVRETEGHLEQLWSLLEELHVRVTITKPLGTNTRGELHTVHRDIQCVCTEIGVCRSRLKRCQMLLIDSAAIIQDLSRAHFSLSRSVSTSLSIESVWTELLLQSNMEQFDEVQGKFQSLEQQTTNFQIHLEGLTSPGDTDFTWRY